jgi:hypothetical protein
MITTRRSFLKGVLALGVASTLPLPSFAAPLPTIYSNGFDDDTAGLNALFAGEPFHVENEGVIAANGIIRGANLCVSSPLIVAQDNFQMTDSLIQALPEFKGEAVLQILGRRGYFAHNWIRSNGNADCVQILRPHIIDARRVEFRA